MSMSPARWGYFCQRGSKKHQDCSSLLAPQHTERGVLHGTGGVGMGWRWERVLGSHQLGLGAHPETMWAWLMQLN